MSGNRLLATILTLALVNGLAGSQPPAAPKASAPAAAQEDIEIMRRLINRSLTDAYASSSSIGFFQRFLPPNPTLQGDQALKYFLGNTIATQPTDLNNTLLYAVRPYNESTLTSVAALRNANVNVDGWAEAAYLTNNRRLPLTTEGAYLKGHGVVFTLTLPPHETIEQEPRKNLAVAFCAKCHEHLPHKFVFDEIYQDKEATKVLAEKVEQGPSAWEQTRREIRGIKGEPKKEPPPAPAKKQPFCGPSLVADAVLRTLAENGKHFDNLRPEENLTVVITFRPWNGPGVASNDSFWLDVGFPAAVRESLGGGVAMADFDSDGMVDLFVTNANNGLNTIYRNRGYGKFQDVTAQAGVNAQHSNQNQKPATDSGSSAGAPSAKTEPDDAKKAVDKAIEFLKRNQPTDARDYELLGDLHMKQGRFEEAIKAYEKAVQENPSSVALRSKHLEALKSHVDVTQKQLEADKPKLEEMRKQLIEAAQEYANALGGKKKETPAAPAPPPPPPLPTKLTISAPKRLLDQVGQGKLGFDDFKKSPDVTVEYYQAPAASEKK